MSHPHTPLRHNTLGIGNQFLIFVSWPTLMLSMIVPNCDLSEQRISPLTCTAKFPCWEIVGNYGETESEKNTLSCLNLILDVIDSIYDDCLVKTSSKSLLTSLLMPFKFAFPIDSAMSQVGFLPTVQMTPGTRQKLMVSPRNTYIHPLAINIDVLFSQGL